MADKHPHPDVSQDFIDQPGSNHVFPDGNFRIAGVWTGTGGNVLDPTLATVTPTPTDPPSDPGDAKTGYLNLSVAAGAKRGSEIQTLQTYGYGFYACRMRVTPVSGTVASFFWIESRPGNQYGPHEWDIEFLTNESPRTKVHFTRHPSNATEIFDLGFDWSAAFHDYGFLWTPGSLVYTVDRKPVFTMTDPELATGVTGFIMANAWTGNPNWGGGPPATKSTTSYSYMRHWAGATSIP